jgi:hypothetical protein
MKSFFKKNPWSTTLNLVDFRVKKYFYNENIIIKKRFRYPNNHQSYNDQDTSNQEKK